MPLVHRLLVLLLHLTGERWIWASRRRQSVYSIELLRGIASGLRIADGRVRIVDRLSEVANARNIARPPALGLVYVAVSLQVGVLNGHVGAPGELALVGVTLCHCRLCSTIIRCR